MVAWHEVIAMFRYAAISMLDAAWKTESSHKHLHSAKRLYKWQPVKLSFQS